MKVTTLEGLNGLSVTTRLPQMKKNLQKSDFIIAEMALLGQITLLFAQSNTGKTLLILFFLIQAIKEGKIKGEDLIYINADDNYNGLYTKGLIANQHGFRMISPHESRVTAVDLICLLSNLARDGELAGKIIILDTLKKFTDMMSKSSLSNFFEILRSLCMKGATVIIAGHTNKHKDEDGDLIYEGTGDTLNDCDCAYAMYKMSEPEDENQVVEFRNLKSRGSAISKVSYQYKKADGQSYEDMVNSVTKLTNQQASTQVADKQKSDKQVAFKDEISFIEDVLANGPLNQTDIQQERKKSTEPTKPSRRKLTEALDLFVDELWMKTSSNNNQSIYKLIGDVSP